MTSATLLRYTVVTFETETNRANLAVSKQMQLGTVSCGLNLHVAT